MFNKVDIKREIPEPVDPNFESRIRDSFSRQKLMTSIGARLGAVRAGEVEIVLAYREDLTQQNGYLHAAIVTAIADSACGYAAYSLMPADRDVLSVEFKVNLLAPAAGEKFVATGRIVRSGRTLTVCCAEVSAESNGEQKLIAVMQGTMIAV